MLYGTLNVSLVWVCFGCLGGGTFGVLELNNRNDGLDEACAKSHLIASSYELTILPES